MRVSAHLWPDVAVARVDPIGERALVVINVIENNELWRKISVAPMMDWTDGRSSAFRVNRLPATRTERSQSVAADFDLVRGVPRQAANFSVGRSPMRAANTSSISALKSRHAPFTSAETLG